MYSEKAKAMRRCRHVYPDGKRCKGWAVWGDPRQLCSGHAYAGQKRRRRRRNDPLRYHTAHARPILCRCAAYAWPHRPGGGLCCWPDEPYYRCLTPAGTRMYGIRLRRPR